LRKNIKQNFLKNPITKNKTKCHFQAPPILNIFFKKSGIDPWVSRINLCFGIDVAQPIWLSVCPA
jgi:hypothetical protein